MKTKTNKSWIIVISIIALFFLALLALPFLFNGKITEIAKKELNKKLTANVDFKTLNVSFIRSFPNASVSLKDLYVIGTDSFATDTLLFSKDVNMVINLKSLFSDTGYEVKKLQISDSKVMAHVLKSGLANWDIMKKDSAELLHPDTSKMKFNFKLHDFIIRNADVIYLDDAGDMTAKLAKVNLNLSGDLTADSSLLKTSLQIDTLDFWNGKIKYANKIKLVINADINADLNSKRYEIANNEMKINAIPLSLNGWVQLLDSGYDMDLKLNSQKVDFKSILSLIPAIYSTSFDKLKAEGKVDLSGFVKGKMEGEKYPAFDFLLNVTNGWFQYPDLPKSVQKIQLKIQLTNPGGSLDNTVVDVSDLSFNMGGNPFSAQMRILTPMSDPDMTMKAVGKIDLGMIKDVYPLEKGTQLNGLLDMNVNLAGKMSYYEKNQYDKFRFGGDMNVRNMLLKMKDLTQDVTVSNANMKFNDRYLNLTDLKMKIGRNDLTANGKAENYMAYALRDKTLKGDFNINSGYMNINDFMGSSNAEKDTSSMTVIKIPKNLDLALNGTIKELIYDKMNFKNATASLKVANGDLNIQKMNVNAFGGVMGLTGTYSSSNPQKPSVDFDLDMKEISFTDIFSQVTSMQKFAPIFDKAVGRFNSKLKINTLLQQNMMPVFTSVLGNGSLNSKAVALKNVEALTKLASAMKRTDIANMALKDIALQFEIKDGRVQTKPFTIKASDVQMNLGGSTGLDQTINYVGSVKLPDKLNLGKFSNVGFKILGTFSKPQIQLDLKSTLNSIIDDKKELVKQKVDSVKNRTLDKGRAEREKALQQAQAKADQIMSKAKLAGDKLIEKAQIQGDSLVAKTTNPIMKLAAKKGAEQLVKEAKKQADNLNAKAKTEADKVIQEANKATAF